MTGVPRSERGVALLLALFALLVVGGLVAAGFAVALQEQRMGRNTAAVSHAFAAAQTGAARVVLSWDSAFAGLAVGDSVPIGGGAGPGGATYSAQVLRLSPTLFLVASEGVSAAGLAGYRVGLVLRWNDTAAVPLRERGWALLY